MSIKLFVSAVLTTTAILATMSYLKLSASPHQSSLDKFSQFKKDFKKSYASPQENAYRFNVFQDNLAIIAGHKNPSYTLGINKFADLTFVEFSNQYLMKNFETVKLTGQNKCSAATTPEPQALDSVDWANSGKVQRVKNQAQCGSCWAFSTVGSIESAYAISGKPMPDLSEQELVDCAGGDYGNMGCNGGLMPWAFTYILDNGVHSETKYPYKGVDGTCSTKSLDKPAYGISSCKMIGANTDSLTKALETQPVSVAFYVNTSFQMYTGGVYNPWFCLGQPNHAVLAVGFDTTASTPFYKVKNSWGSSWGEKGYFRIAIKTGEGTCHIAGSGMSSVPVL